MNFSALLQATFQDPRGTFRQVMALRLPTTALWQGLILTVVVGVMLTSIGLLLDPIEPPAAFAFMTRPFVNFALQACFMVIFVLILHGFLRISGGTNRLDDVILAVAWVQGMLCILSAGQLVLMLVSPILAALLGLVSFVVFVWLMVMFVGEAAGFPSAVKPVLIISVSLTIAGIFAGILMLLSGAVDPREFANV